MDASRSIQRIKLDVSPVAQEEQQILKQAIACVEYAELAAMELAEVTARRKMLLTQEHVTLADQARILGLRLYRNLWELTLSDSDRKNLRCLIRRVASLSVWEDLPATMAGKSYDHVSNGMDGTIAYQHAFGVSFIEYKAGKAEFGWTLLRDTLEDNVLLARSASEAAAAYMLPVT